MEDVSVTIITKNEEDNIVHCLESTKWASEVIVVDHFSEDRTVEISSRHGALVFRERWRGYGRQKNSAIEKAKGPWVLSIDADERVTSALRDEILATVGDRPKCNGYFISRKNFFCGQLVKHGGWAPDYNLRLFRKECGRFEERQIHEKAVVQGRVGFLTQAIEHHTYKSVGDYLKRLNLYSMLAAEDMVGSGKRARWHQPLLRPAYTFVKMYILRAGFLDGMVGLFLAVSYAYYTFLKYMRLREKTVGWHVGSLDEIPVD